MAKNTEQTLSEDEKQQIEFSKSFIKKTKAILSQYEEKVSKSVSTPENHKTVLLINCLYGLLMMPSKLNYKKLELYDSAENVLSENSLLGDDKITLEMTERSKAPTFAQFVRSMRNGLGHWNETRKNDKSFQGVKINNKEGKITIFGSYTLYKNKEHDRDEVIHTKTCINLLNPKIIFSFLELVCEPKIYSIKIEKNKSAGACAWKKTKVYVNSKNINYYEPHKILWKLQNELTIQIGEKSESFFITQLPASKTVIENNATYTFTIMKDKEPQ